MYGQKKKADFDWQSWQKLFLLATIVLVGWMYWPALYCTFQAADERELGELVHESPTRQRSEGRSAETERLAQATSLTGGFFHDTGVCFRTLGWQTAEPWNRYGLVGAGLLFVVFSAGRSHQLKRGGSTYGR